MMNCAKSVRLVSLVYVKFTKEKNQNQDFESACFAIRPLPKFGKLGPLFRMSRTKICNSKGHSFTKLYVQPVDMCCIPSVIKLVNLLSNPLSSKL